MEIPCACLLYTSPLTAAVNGLENSIATLTVRDDARLELAADFCGLFLMTDKQAALPYACLLYTSAVDD